VDLAGAEVRRLAIYCADYDPWGREQRVDVLDAQSGARLDSRTLAQFSGGQYLAWNVTGHVILRVTRLAGPNAVVSGVFLR
jgi:hypothetical protein